MGEENSDTVNKVFEDEVDVKNMLLILFFVRCPLTVRGQGKSRIHQGYAFVETQYLSVYRNQAD